MRVPTSTIDWCISLLDLVAEDRRGGGEQLRDMRPQLPGLRVDDLELLFHAEREAMHWG